MDFELRGTLPRLCLLHRLSLGLTSYTMYMAFLSMGSSGTEEAALPTGVQLTIVACFSYNNLRAYIAASSRQRRRFIYHLYTQKHVYVRLSRLSMLRLLPPLHLFIISYRSCTLHCFRINPYTDVIILCSVDNGDTCTNQINSTVRRVW